MRKLRLNGRRLKVGNGDALSREIEELMRFERRLARLGRVRKAKDALKGVARNGGRLPPKVEMHVRRVLAGIAAADGDGDGGEGGGVEVEEESSPRLPRWLVIAALVLLLGLAVVAWLTRPGVALARGYPTVFVDAQVRQMAALKGRNA